MLYVDADTETRKPVSVNRLDSSESNSMKEKLLNTLKLPVLPSDELQQLKDFLIDHHDVFSLKEGESEATDIVQLFEINTGDAPPQKQPPRRMPFVVRQRY